MPNKTEEYTTEELEILGQKEQVEDEELALDQDDDDLEPDAKKEEEAEGDEKPAAKKEGEEDADKDDRPVNFGALKKERSLRKEIQTERDVLRDKFVRLEERTKMLMEAIQGQQQQQKPEVAEEDIEPDPNTDPYGYMEWQNRQLKALREKVEGKEQRETQEAEVERYIQHGASLAQQVRQQDPEKYDNALNFLVERRTRELRVLGKPPETIEQTINYEMRQGMIQALQNGQNPGEFMLQYAEAAGFQYAPKAPEKDKSVRDLIQAQKQNRTLGKSPTGKAPDPGTPEDLANMTDDEFEAYYTKVGKKGFAAAFK